MTEQEKKADVFFEIEKAQKEGCNLLMPSTHIQGLSEFHAPVLERVLLSANPQDGDVYAHDNDKDGPKKKWRPTKQALMKLSVCAGVIWSVNESRRLDNGANRDYIAYRAVGGIKKADGQPVFFSADYDLDFEVMEEELRELYEKKARGEWMQNKSTAEKAEYVEFCVKRDMLQKRKFKLRLCESGAMNRVLRMLLGIKQAYTTEELQKPFVMARIVFRPDFTDKSVRDRFIDASIKAMTGIYGPGVAAPSRTEKTEPIDVTPLPEEKPEEPENGKGENIPVDPNDSLLADFEACSPEEKEKAVLRLADKKGYGVSTYLTKCGKKKLTELTAETMTKLFTHLLSLADMTAEDQIPF